MLLHLIFILLSDLYLPCGLPRGQDKIGSSSTCCRVPVSTGLTQLCIASSQSLLRIKPPLPGRRYHTRGLGTRHAEETNSTNKVDYTLKGELDRIATVTARHQKSTVKFEISSTRYQLGPRTCLHSQAFTLWTRRARRLSLFPRTTTAISKSTTVAMASTPAEPAVNGTSSLQQVFFL